SYSTLPCRAALGLLCLSALIGACKKGDSAQAAVTFTEKAAPPDALFHLLKPADSGVDFANNIAETHLNTILTNSYLYNGGGVGVLDVNNDGLQDIFFVSTQEACRLYLNQGGLKFKDITGQAGVGIKEGDKTGVTVVDINADGWQDIYVCRTGMSPSENRRNLLFVNNKNGTFSEQGKQYGLADGAASNHANFFDADGDGDLDVYVLNYPVDFKSVNSVRLMQPDGGGEPVRLTEPKDPSESSHLYRNNGDGTFTDIAESAGVQFGDVTPGAGWGDIDGDGDLDLYVSAYLSFNRKAIWPPFAKNMRNMRVMMGPQGLKGAADHLYRNDGGGKFTDVTKEAGLRVKEEEYGFTIQMVDLNGDDLIDIFVADDMTPNHHYRAVKPGKFTPCGSDSGLSVDHDGVNKACMGVA
ncbi:MAG TPA: VCBS repeat-containing protein, partial [Saprospiraceae bacterium]|nr:VCBS repeat-containing protein [Saprospiraceae bacterium]